MPLHMYRYILYTTHVHTDSLPILPQVSRRLTNDVILASFLACARHDGFQTTGLPWIKIDMIWYCTCGSCIAKHECIYMYTLYMGIQCAYNISNSLTVAYSYMTVSFVHMCVHVCTCLNGYSIVYMYIYIHVWITFNMHVWITIVHGQKSQRTSMMIVP